MSLINSFENPLVQTTFKKHLNNCIPERKLSTTEETNKFLEGLRKPQLLVNQSNWHPITTL